MSLVLTDIQKVGASVAAVDAKGNPAALDGVPVWSVSDPTILTVTPSADGLSADVVANGPLGTAQVNVSADADVGSGITNLAGTIDIEVVSSQAVALNIGTDVPVNA